MLLSRNLQVVVMVSKDKRQEVWRRNKPYMSQEETIEDLLPCCKRCENFNKVKYSEDYCEDKDKCPIFFQLWLSNEYLEWSCSI